MIPKKYDRAASHPNIPLEKLMLCWTPRESIMAVLWPDVSDHGFHLHCSDLACSAGWAEMDRNARMDKLYRVLGQIIVRDGVPLAAVRRSLSYCPEAVEAGLAPHPPSKRGGVILCSFSQIDDDGHIPGPFA